MEQERSFAMREYQRENNLPRGVSRVKFEAVNLGGPGGQRRNRSYTDTFAVVELAAPELIEYFGSETIEVTARGSTGAQSKKEARQRVFEKIDQAWEAIAQEQRRTQWQKRKEHSKEPESAKRKRVEDKRRLGDTKRLRGRVRE